MKLRAEGGIIYITGLLGAGKTILINAALENIPELRHMPVYITRPLREYEQDSRYEITQVTHEEYVKARSNSSLWDHTEVLGNWYGADVEIINNFVDQGQWFIISSPIEIDKLYEMQAHYKGHGQSYIIWIDTALATANQRLRLRDGTEADKRIKDPTQSEELAHIARSHAGFIFKPSGDLKQDESNFIRVIESLIR